MPGLTVALTLNTFSQSSRMLGDFDQSQSPKESANDLVAFVSGLLLGNNIEVKNWFSQFIKCGQGVFVSAVNCYFYLYLHV